MPEETNAEGRTRVNATHRQQFCGSVADDRLARSMRISREGAPL
jgi:hypothetical protein